MERWPWQRLLARLGLAAAVGLATDALPLGWVVGPAWKPLQSGVAVVMFVCLVGKAVMDTFFYDRYQP